jgi:hypothetical protein
MKAIRTITFSDHVRPFVINHDATRVYANLNNLLGFEIADVKTGEVIKRIEAPAEMWKAKWGDLKQRFFGHGCPSHGISMTQDESEIWVVDNINYGVLVYDNTGEWPVLKMTFPTTASADWITMGIDGQYAFLSSADVVDVKTKLLAWAFVLHNVHLAPDVSAAGVARSRAALNGRTSSEILADWTPGARLVKSISNIPMAWISDFSLKKPRTAIFTSGDDANAKRVVIDLLNQIGFAGIDLGSLAEGGAMHEVGAPLSGVELHFVRRLR